MASPTGTLKINVYGENVGVPIANASVRVFNEKDIPTSATPLEELITSDTGETAEIDLAAPAKDLSLQPESKERPYALYNLSVSGDGFESVIIQGVQVFEDTTAIQNVYLKSFASESRDNEEELLMINPHTLYYDYPPKIPEDEVKEMPAPTGFVVLDKVVIPETVVVHQGKPDDKNAKNYYVPYKDYIKNVASCEIYSTWPRETIKANVLAIISFTLNRVYTEWYRNKNKNFTITSSTAYDHAFSYGRNIFKEISSVVDEIFNTYVTRPNINQPLFTQYCDGKKVSCPTWMTQWGSKDLGDKGYQAIDILKKFYGNDIYLTSAEKVSGIPQSYKGNVLKVGSNSDDVKTIQNQLNAISKNYPAIPKVKADGSYGNSTKDAVKKFQSIFNLPTTGSVDFSTWYKISDVYVAVKKMAELK